jgi:uncharacterized integral membrane protein
MRYVYVLLVIAFTAVVLAAVALNYQSVTVSLLVGRITLPLSLLILLVYLLGALTGGFVVSVLRHWIHGATRRR